MSQLRMSEDRQRRPITTYETGSVLSKGRKEKHEIAKDEMNRRLPCLSRSYLHNLVPLVSTYKVTPAATPAACSALHLRMITPAQEAEETLFLSRLFQLQLEVEERGRQMI